MKPMQPIDGDIQKAMDELMPVMLAFTRRVQEKGIDRTRINVPNGCWVYISDDGQGLEDLIQELQAALMSEREYTGNEPGVNIQEGFYQEKGSSLNPPPQKQNNDDLTDKFEERLDDDSINYTNIKKLADKYNKEKIERLADDMGYVCDWDNNYLVKKDASR